MGYGLDGGGEAVSEGTCSVSDLGEEVLVEKAMRENSTQRR